MAIVKASYTRSRAKIKAALRYIVHRPGREGERLTRTLFSGEKTLSKAEAYRLIDEKRGMTYFHLKINFHPKREDTRKDLDLRTITSQTIATLEERFNRPIRYFAVEHNDHTELRHIHAIVLINSTVVIWSGHIGSREDHALLLGKDLRKDLVHPGTLS